MLAKLADRMFRWRWAILATWIAVITLGGLFGPRVFDNLGIDNGFDPGTESVAAVLHAVHSRRMRRCATTPRSAEASL